MEVLIWWQAAWGNMDRISVSILVLMEVLIWSILRRLRRCRSCMVSILVLMEVLIWYHIDGYCSVNDVVSILVLMEVLIWS